MLRSILLALLLIAPRAAAALARAACDSRQVQGFAIKSISDGNGPVKDVPAATDCEAACCETAAARCTGWSFTPFTRTECPSHGCCFLKTASAASVNAHMEPFSNFTTGCIGFDCAKPPGPPHPAPAPSPPGLSIAKFAQILKTFEIFDFGQWN